MRTTKIISILPQSDERHIKSLKMSLAAGKLFLLANDHDNSLLDDPLYDLEDFGAFIESPDEKISYTFHEEARQIEIHCSDIPTIINCLGNNGLITEDFQNRANAKIQQCLTANQTSQFTQSSPFVNQRHNENQPPNLNSPTTEETNTSQVVFVTG